MNRYIMPIERLFLLGMKAVLPALLAPRAPTEAEVEEPNAIWATPRVLNLGAGNSPMEGAVNLDYPEWDARTGEIPATDSSVDAIYAFHFMEHLTGEQAIAILREVERVLRPGGIFTTVTPHRLGSMAFHDLDHKSFWTEDTWKTLLRTPWYDKNREVPWRLQLSFNAIMGLSERNLCLMSQLIKAR